MIFIDHAGFEEQRPPLLLGIIVRDKRKRPYNVDLSIAHVTKKVKVEIDIPQVAETPVSALPLPSTQTAPVRSYTPPPNRDPRLKATPYVPPTVPLPSLATSPPTAIQLELSKPEEPIIEDDDMSKFQSK